VEFDLIRESTDWLLGEASGIDEMMKHPAAATRDVQGQPWHIFDLDPTSTVLGHRALPLHDELPEPQRRSENTGAPGHMGRKRGDIKFQRTTVQHAGSAAWIHEHLSPGNVCAQPGMSVSTTDLPRAGGQEIVRHRHGRWGIGPAVRFSLAPPPASGIPFSGRWAEESAREACPGGHLGGRLRSRGHGPGRSAEPPRMKSLAGQTGPK